MATNDKPTFGLGGVALLGMLTLGLGVLLGMQTSAPPPTPARAAAAPGVDPDLVHELRELVAVGRALLQQPQRAEPPTRVAASPATNADAQPMRELCDAIYALAEQRGGASHDMPLPASIPATNSRAVEAMLVTMRDRRDLPEWEGELLMQSRQGLLQQLGKPTSVEISQLGTPIWHYVMGDETLMIDFSVGGYVIGMRRSERSR